MADATRRLPTRIGKVITIRNVEPADSAAWLMMRRDLWPGDDDSHAEEIAAFFAGTLEEPQAVMLAENESRTPVGLLELYVRTDLEGLAGKRVGYVEGLFVVPAFRGRGVARQLLQAARSWARENDCDAFASDRAERVIVDRSF